MTWTPASSVWIETRMALSVAMTLTCSIPSRGNPGRCNSSVTARATRADGFRAPILHFGTSF